MARDDRDAATTPRRRDRVAEQLFHLHTPTNRDRAIKPLTDAFLDRELRRMGFSYQNFRMAFEEGFIDRDVLPGDRKYARDTFLHWLRRLGYDDGDFDWDLWDEEFTGDTP